MKKLLPLLLLLLLPKPVFGQESISITAIPPRLEVSGLPGATLQETLKIRNESEEPMAFEAAFSDFIVNNNQGTPVAVTEAVSGRWSLSSWITVSPKKLLLQPKETQTVNLIIQIPPNGLPGGHYAMVTYQPSFEGLIGQPKQTASAVIQKVGTLVYLNVIGDVTEAANLKSFTADKFFKYYGPTKINAEIENLGDIHLQPQGKLAVTNLLNQTVFSQDLDAKNIFPFASRVYDFTVPGQWHLGRYTAKINAVIGTSQQPVQGLIYFWIVPVKEIALAAGILVLIIILIFLLKRRRKPEYTSLNA
ncbi:MAG: hypothetical protein AAB430_04060 [Patescibacteria group bacterium]